MSDAWNHPYSNKALPKPVVLVTSILCQAGCCIWSKAIVQVHMNWIGFLRGMLLNSDFSLSLSPFFFLFFPLFFSFLFVGGRWGVTKEVRGLMWGGGGWTKMRQSNLDGIWTSNQVVSKGTWCHLSQGSRGYWLQNLETQCFSWKLLVNKLTAPSIPWQIMAHCTDHDSSTKKLLKSIENNFHLYQEFE